MRETFRYPLIAALILIISILVLPNVEATRRGIKPTATVHSAASNHESAESAGGGRFRLASFSLPEDEVFADLRVTKLVDSEQATPGMNLTYTITVHNDESFDVAAVTLSDELPEGLVFVSLTKPDNWTCETPMVGEGGTVSCTKPSLAANADDVFTLVVNIPSQAPGATYTNVATVSSTTPDSNEENNSSPATTTVQPKNADLTVKKLVDSEQAIAGDNLTYTITVYNGESSAADNAALNDTLPAGTTFVSLSKPAGWSCTMPDVGEEGSINCTIPSLAINSADVFTVVVKISENAPAGTTYTNTAVVGSTTTDPNEENNSSTVVTTIISADLEVFKVDTPDPASSGSHLTYTITLQNNGPDAAADASLSDTLPTGTTFVSLSAPSGWLCTTPAAGAAGTINCSKDTPVTESAVFTLVVQIDSGVSAGTLLTNTATVTSSTPDPFTDNNSGTATTTVLNLRGWMTAASSGVTEDESNPARPVYTNFTAAVNSGSPAGAYVLRYNIQAADGLAGPGANTRLRVRFRDEGAGSRVRVAIMASPITGKVATLGTIFDSDNFAPGSGFQTQVISMPAITFNFTHFVYWLEVTMTKSGATNQPGFGAAQIYRQ